MAPARRPLPPLWGFPLENALDSRGSHPWLFTAAAPRLFAGPITFRRTSRELSPNCPYYALNFALLTAIGGEALFDRIELFRSLDDLKQK